MKVVFGIGHPSDPEIFGRFLESVKGVKTVNALAVVPQAGWLPTMLEHPVGWRREVERLSKLDREQASELLASFKAKVERPGIAVSTHFVSGDPAQELINSAQRIEADLIVVSRHHKLGNEARGVGHVAGQVARYAHCSVLLLDSQRPNPRTLLFAADGSSQSERAGGVLRDLDIRDGLILVLCKVIPGFAPTFINSGGLGYSESRKVIQDIQSTQEYSAKESLLRLSKSFREEKFRKKIIVRAGDPTERLLEVIEESGVDLIVLGAKGMSPVSRFLLGSITVRLMERASCSVLIGR